MYKIQYCSYMIANRFGKRESFSDQSGNSLSYCVIEPFNITRFSAFFRNRTMPLRRKYFLICGPEICITYGTLPIYRRKRCRSVFSSVSDMISHDFFCDHINRQPYPLLIMFISYERKQFVALYDQTAFFYCLHLSVAELIHIYC